MDFILRQRSSAETWFRLRRFSWRRTLFDVPAKTLSLFRARPPDHRVDNYDAENFAPVTPLRVFHPPDAENARLTQRGPFCLRPTLASVVSRYFALSVGSQSAFRPPAIARSELT
jgi:hypothetical protein